MNKANINRQLNCAIYTRKSSDEGLDQEYNSLEAQRDAGLAFIAIWFGFSKEVGVTDYIDCVQNAGQDQTKIEQCADQFKQTVENRFSVTFTPTP